MAPQGPPSDLPADIQGKTPGRKKDRTMSEIAGIHIAEDAEKAEPGKKTAQKKPRTKSTFMPQLTETDVQSDTTAPQAHRVTPSQELLEAEQGGQEPAGDEAQPGDQDLKKGQKGKKSKTKEEREIKRKLKQTAKKSHPGGRKEAEEGISDEPAGEEMGGLL
ncbi:uncharacterized protein LOC144488701 [Mustelus asterias]